jgi:hypothetical protein
MSLKPVRDQTWTEYCNEQIPTGKGCSWCQWNEPVPDEEEKRICGLFMEPVTMGKCPACKDLKKGFAYLDELD